MHRAPRRNVYTRSNIRKQVRQLSFVRLSAAERPPPPAGKVSLGETPPTYRVIATGGRSGNATLLKDIACDNNKLAPRVLILANDAACAFTDGTRCSYADLKLDIFDEVYVEAVTPWWSNKVQNWVWSGADEPCRIPGFCVEPHAAACNALLKKRCDTKRTVSFVKTLLPSPSNQLRLSVVDPMNEETRTVEDRNDEDTQLIDGSLWNHETRHEGLPIYVTHAVTPPNTFTVPRKAIFVPAENIHWFQASNEFRRLPRGFFKLKWVEPVETARNIPVADIERLVSPYKVDYFEHENAIKDHEEALASSVALAMAHQQGMAQKETLRIPDAIWREEEGKLYGQFKTTLPGQENRRKLASYARYYPTEANLTLRKLEANKSSLLPSSSKHHYNMKASTDCTVSDAYVDEDGNFELEIVMEKAYAAFRELQVTNLEEMHQNLFEVRPQVAPLIPRGITRRFRDGELLKTILSEGKLEDGTLSKRLEEKIETLKAFLGGGVYEFDKLPTERQIQLVHESDFNTQQKNAILAFFDGWRQGIVIAGAGTGKTTVLAGAVQIMCDRANAQEDQLVQDNNRIVRQNYGVEEYDPATWLHEPRLPEVRPWLITAPSNAAVGNGIQACVRRCGKQFKFIALMGATALKKIYGGMTPWQKHLAPAMINDMAADGERWGLSQHEYVLFARAISICSKRFSCLSNVNWTQLVNEKETDEDDATVLRLVLQAVIRRYRPQAIFGTVSTIIRHMDALTPFVDLVCLDEASTCPEIATLAVLLSAESPRKTMLIGDNVQLGPHEANLHSRNKKIGFRSVLDAVLDRKYLEGEGNMKVVQLTESHRFEKQVGEFVSRAFYDGKMTTSPNKERHRKMIMSSFPLPRNGVPMVAVDIGGEESRNVVMSFSVKAHTEAVTSLVTALKVFVPTASVGIVCFYNGQIDALLDDGCPIPKHDVHSVDSSQGLEYDIVIVVPARAEVNEERDSEFLGSKKRQCVSFSRAKCGFILVGALSQLEKVETWKETLDILYEYTDRVGPEYVAKVNGMVEVALESQAAANNIAQPTYPVGDAAEDEVQAIDDESPEVRQFREAFNIAPNDPHFSPSMARGIDLENLDRHSDSTAQSQGDADMDAIEQLERVSTPPGLVGEPQQPPSGELQNLEAMDLSTSDDPMDRTIHDDLEELERVLGDYDRIQQ